jgi:hypothetical protein
MAGPPEWTPALVVDGLRKAFATQPRFDEPPASFTIILERARQLLGKDSPEYVALILRVTAPVGLSIREMCRERYGWHHSRSELYRRSNHGAERVAAALQRDGVPIPGGLQTGPLA